jgi:hypothetical protein
LSIHYQHYHRTIHSRDEAPWTGQISILAPQHMWCHGLILISESSTKFDLTADCRVLRTIQLADYTPAASPSPTIQHISLTDHFLEDTDVLSLCLGRITENVYNAPCSALFPLFPSSCAATDGVNKWTLPALSIPSRRQEHTRQERNSHGALIMPEEVTLTDRYTAVHRTQRRSVAAFSAFVR